MRVIINTINSKVISVLSNSAIKQNINGDEFEIKVTDQDIIDAFNRGEELLYNQNIGKVYYEPKIEIDPEKAVLYEAVANLFEEVQILKAQLGGDK